MHAAVSVHCYGLVAEVGGAAPVAAVGRDRPRAHLRRLAVVDTGRAALPPPRASSRLLLPRGDQGKLILLFLTESVETSSPIDGAIRQLVESCIALLSNFLTTHILGV